MGNTTMIKSKAVSGDATTAAQPPHPSPVSSHNSKDAGPSFSSSCTVVSHAPTRRTAHNRALASSIIDQHLVLMYLPRVAFQYRKALCDKGCGRGCALALVLVVPELEENSESLPCA